MITKIVVTYGMEVSSNIYIHFIPPVFSPHV
jgi:hypothetical protein